MLAEVCPSVAIADGTMGFSDKAPYDRILVAAGGAYVPQAYEQQLADRVGSSSP